MDSLEGKIEARNEETGKILWDVVIYTVKIDPSLEQDVQWVFITGLAVRDNTLLVTNEKNERYILDLKTRKVEKVKRTKRRNRECPEGTIPSQPPNNETVVTDEWSGCNEDPLE